MHSLDGNLISVALRRSFAPNCKKKITNFDEHIIASARRVFSTKIEFTHCPAQAISNFSESLKSKYIVFKSIKTKRKKLKKTKNKHRQCENSVSQMKNTELSGQDHSLPEPKVVLFSPDDVQLGWKGSVPVGCGFVNLGTTCYINSTLQALFHVPSFVNWLIDDKKHHIACEKMNGMLHTECLVCAMSKTLQASHRLSGGSLRPRHIIEKVKSICKHLSPFRQEDAHEFLRYLMEAMEKSYIAILGIQAKKLDSFSKETTPLSQIFGGYIRTEVTCMECSHVSTTFQHFQDLILDIRQNSTNTVYDALENYFSKERLDGDEAYHCVRCKKKVSAYKKFAIEKAPNALCIQLKRFNISSFYGGSKVSKVINIPQTIDLCKFKHRKGAPNGMTLKYRLVSMVFHHGPSAYSGHYTALGCTSSGSYYYFNDDQVYATHLGQYTHNSNAYIMFYEREKSNAAENSLSLKIAATHSLSSSLSNGCANGTSSQRTNGFFKRENSFSSTSNHHSRRPSWEFLNNNNENKTPVKSFVPVSTASSTTVATSSIVKSTSTSLVPYMSSDSDSSDSEEEMQKLQQRERTTTDSNNNSRVNDSHSTPSSLAKKNSTLTSLLATSPKNDSGTSGSGYRTSSSSSSSSFGSATPSSSSSLSMPSLTKSPIADGRKDSSHADDFADGQNGGGKSSTLPHTATPNEPKLTEKRGFISFNIFNRNKVKPERADSKVDGSSSSSRSASSVGNGENESSGSNSNNSGNVKGSGGDEPKLNSAKQMLVGIATMYFSGKDAKKETSDEEKTKTNGSDGGQEAMGNGDACHAEKVRVNGSLSGIDKVSTSMMNGGGGGRGGGKASNGWIVTDIDDADHGSTNGDEKCASPSKLIRGEWIITERGGRRSMPSPSKFKEFRENGKKCNGTFNDYKSDSSRNDSHDLLNTLSHSTQNGYGGKVLTWNGELSHINREAELERKEATKRNHEYDDEQDRGKVKKIKYYNGNENHSHSQSPRKNVIQQYHNRYNQNKRPWSFNQNSNHYNRRYNGPSNNNNGDFFRPKNGNNYGYRHANYVHKPWRH